jgi:hypothetical protein
MASMRAEDHYGSTGGRGHHTGYHEDDAVRFSFIQDNVLITQNDTWEVIVSQQVNSFNHFLFNTIQDIVEEVGRIVIKPERQYKPGDKRFFGMAAIIRWSDLRAEVRAAARLPEAHL